MKKIINTPKAPAAIGPYSQAVLAGNTLYISGQVPINPETGKLAEGITEQTEQVMKNIKAILDEAGFTFQDVVKSTLPHGLPRPRRFRRSGPAAGSTCRN